MDDDLLIGAGIDLGPLHRDIARATADIDGFLGKLKTSFARQSADAREQLFLGLTDRSGFRQKGAELAADFNRGVLQAIRANAEAGTLTNSLHRTLVGELKNAGLEAGASFQRAAQSQINITRILGTTTTAGQSAARSFALVNSESGKLTALGSKLGTTLIGVSFALDGVARGGASVESGFRQALRALTGFGVLLGPEGAIASGLAATLTVALDFFNRTRDEANKTAKAIAESFGKGLQTSVESNDLGAASLAIQRRIQQLTEGIVVFDEKARTISRQGGLAQMLEEEQKQQAKVASANILVLAGEKKTLKAIEDRIAARRTEIAELGALNTKLPDLRLPDIKLRPAQAITTKDPAKDAARDLADLERQIRAVISADALAGTTRAVEDLGGKAVPVYRAMTAALAAHKNEVTDAAIGLRTLANEFARTNAGIVATARVQFNNTVPDLGRPSIPIKPLQVDIIPIVQPNAFSDLQRRFDQEIDAAKLNQVTIDVALATGDTSFADVFGVQLSAISTRATQLGAQLVEAIKASHLPTAQEKALLDEVVKKLNEAGLSAIKPASAIRDTATSLDTFVTAGRGLLNIAGGFGKIDQDARNAAAGILDAMDSMQRFNAARAAGDSLGKVGGVVGIIGGVISIGTSIASVLDRDRQERKAIQEEANRILLQNTHSLDGQRALLAGFQGSVKDLLGVGKIIANPPSSPRFGQMTGGFPTLLGSNAGLRFLFDDALKREGRGGSLAEVEAAARKLNITLYDSAGRVIPGAFAQLQDAINLTIREMTEWQDTLSDSRTKAELFANVHDIEQTPDAIVASWLDTLKGLAPDLFDKFFAGIDLSDGLDPEEMKRAKQGVIALTDAFLKGQISAEQFGELLGKGDLGEIITGMETGFDALADAANSVTSELLNLPAGFKVAAAEFRATLADVPQPPTFFPPQIPTPPPIIPNGPVGVVPPGTPLPSAVAPVNINGPITVMIDGRGKDAAQQAQDLVSALRNWKFLRTGSTVLPGIDS